MVDRIADARRVVAEASDVVDDATVREQLHSVDRGLAAVADEPADAEKGERLESVEAKLVGLGDEVDGDAAEYVATARDLLDDYRRDRTKDW